MARPRHRHALARAAEVRRHLLHPLEGSAHRPRPLCREVRERLVRSPERIPEVLGRHRNRDAIEGGILVWRAVEHALRARTVVAADVDDQRVVEFAEIFHGLDDAADFVVGIGEERAVDIRLFDEELLLEKAERIPLRQFLRPRRQPGVVRHDAQALLVGEDRFAQLVPALVEEVHRADLVDPLRRGVMRRMGRPRDVIDEEGLFGREFLQLLHVLDRLVGHRSLQIPAGIVLERIDGRRVAVQVRLPLTRVAADKAVEILEAHAVRPLIERPGLARLERRRVVVLAEPRCRVAVRPQGGADGALVDRDDRIIARKPRRYFAHHPVSHRVMIPAGDESSARRRAECSRVKIGEAQPLRGDAIEGRSGDHAAKSGRRGEAYIVRHDEQHVGGALRRHDARGPPRRRL